MVIFQEVIHTLRYTKAKKGGMVLKLDLEKAHDRMDWHFVEETLRYIALPIKLINVVMGLLKRSSCQLLWNEEATDTIRQLRESDIFVLCMERLSQWIQSNIDEGTWRPLKASRRGIKKSHLFFANDLLRLLKQEMARLTISKRA